MQPRAGIGAPWWSRAQWSTQGRPRDHPCGFLISYGPPLVLDPQTCAGCRWGQAWGPPHGPPGGPRCGLSEESKSGHAWCIRAGLGRLHVGGRAKRGLLQIAAEIAAAAAAGCAYSKRATTAATSSWNSHSRASFSSFRDCSAGGAMVCSVCWMCWPCMWPWCWHCC